LIELTNSIKKYTRTWTEDSYWRLFKPEPKPEPWIELTNSIPYTETYANNVTAKNILNERRPVRGSSITKMLEIYKEGGVLSNQENRPSDPVDYSKESQRLVDAAEKGKGKGRK